MEMESWSSIADALANQPLTFDKKSAIELKTKTGGMGS